MLWLIEAAVVILCLLWLIPTIGLLITSLRPRTESNSNGWWNVFANPTQITIDNYRDVLTTGAIPFADAFVNSMTVAIPATIIPILIAAFAAYVFTFMHFPGRDVLFIIIVGLLVVPNQVAFVPLSIIFQQMGINGQFATVWLAHTGFGMPLAVYILRNYMASLPKSVVESAEIDGASHWQTFWRLIIPMSTPALASFAIFQFLWVWNDLLVALIFLGQGDNAVLTIALTGVLGTRGENWHLLTAGAFVSMILPLVVFFALQRYFVRGLTAGAVKG
ncbi:sugar ABC transporter permease [Tessaracoccus lapidicaptus]|uniref:Sugar ABC transporter permease n=2 Tax=Propionibacteriaceae TaxID=31957 RepID=A0A1C0AKN6_9ACTN|nr:sugar ABC transporter permease [Tessaracoccus sp. T2.5-30]OCL33130.1 sugar ABC transporter permease [Tessaracoccus lapidicaptus]